MLSHPEIPTSWTWNSGKDGFSQDTKHQNKLDSSWSSFMSGNDIGFISAVGGSRQRGNRKIEENIHKTS